MLTSHVGAMTIIDNFGPGLPMSHNCHLHQSFGTTLAQLLR